MSTDENHIHGSRLSMVTRFTRGRGAGYRGNKRSNSYFRSNLRKRSRPNIQNGFTKRVALDNALSTSSLQSGTLPRSEFFAAPITAVSEHTQNVHIVNNHQYPGWQLYFPTETFVESSRLVVQIKAFENHINNHLNIYVLQEILKQQWFKVSIEFLMTDDVFVSSWTNFMQQLQETPDLVLSCLGIAMHILVTTMTISSAANRESNSTEYQSKKIKVRKIDARPVDFSTITRIAEISPESYDKLFVVQGRVDHIQAIETKCTWVAYKCKRCGHEQAVRQGDHYPLKPFRCRIQCNSKKNFIELRSSPHTIIDCVRMIKLRETGLHCKLESIHRIDIELQKDLVDLVCPGSEITVTGILKMQSLDVTSDQSHQKRNKYNAYMRAVSVVNHTVSEKNCQFVPTQKDLEIVQMIRSEPNCLRLLVNSLAPEMCGQEIVKVAVLLSLVGGFGSQIHDEGEVHMLLVGDPGVGKSHLLQSAANTSELGELISGKSTTNSIATIQQVKFPTGFNTGNFLETGFILTSHDGYCCIDDIDKLSSNQESLIHIMQSKSVTARSTNSSFNVAARNSLLAAVNPASGHYDCLKLLRENVRLSPSLFPLFHLVFVVFDKADKDRDNMLAEHVKALHSGMKKVLSIPSKYSMELKPNDCVPENEDIGLDKRLKVNSDEQLDLLPAILLKKYIAYARQTSKPLLTKEAAEEIKNFYLGLRSEKNNEEHFSITTRQLEGLIRLTQARARVELCLEATKTHACDVIELYRHSYTDSSIAEGLNSTLNESTAGTSHGGQIKKFIQILELRSNASGKNVYEFEELKDMASHAGIKCGVTNLVELVNMQGYLLKKGPNLYEYRN